MTEEQTRSEPSLFKVVMSVMASFFGVQSSRQHEEDFTRGRPLAYIIVGLVMTLVFILTVWFAVQVVVSSAAK